ncbi:hypothetical protein RUM44_005168 [Polyplax serrata]|uniref:Uncharacterized protein n=1 Tax=Polyplax serrata TaxID=468196 RepID=A0ABR1AEA0_POLSC
MDPKEEDEIPTTEQQEETRDGERGDETAEEEPLNEKDVLLSVYNGVVGADNKKWTKEDDEWSVQMNLTQEWFIRCSWINKFLFVEALCKSSQGCFVIESLLKCIESIITKDVVESAANDYGEFTYDRIPRDDNRSLPPGDLDKIMHKDLIWFSGLNPTRQISVIVRLLKLGGGGLVFNIYKSLTSIQAERQVTSGRASLSSASESKITKGSVQIKRNSRSIIAKGTNGSESGKSSTCDEYAGRKLEELRRRDAAIEEYKASKGIQQEDGRTSKKGDAKETIDYLQILPIYLNRRIMSCVDEKVLSGFKRVGRYWGKMIDESINEKSGRRAINAKINKIIGTKPDKKEEKRPEKTENEEKADEGDVENEKDDKLNGFLQLGKKEFLKRNNLCEKVLISSMKMYENVLSKKFKIIKLDKSSYREGSFCWDSQKELMAHSSFSNVVYFYSMRTGSRLNFYVFGFESPITCLALHESRNQIIVGCKDGTLLSKFVRTNKMGTTFPEHKCAVKFLTTTSSNLLSSSADNIIKYFQLWSGVCLLCIDLGREFTVSCQLLLSNSPVTYCTIGTTKGVLILVDPQKKMYTKKVKLHDGEITCLAHSDNTLVTSDENGRIRVWDVKKLEFGDAPRPFYDISAATAVSSLFLHNNQVAIVGCEIKVQKGYIRKPLRVAQ